MDTSKAGDGDLQIKVEGPEGCSPEAEVTKLTDNHYKVGNFVSCPDRNIVYESHCCDLSDKGF